MGRHGVNRRTIRLESARYQELVNTGAGALQRAQRAEAMLREKTAQLQRDSAGLIAARKKIDVLTSARES